MLRAAAVPAFRAAHRRRLGRGDGEARVVRRHPLRPGEVINGDTIVAADRHVGLRRIGAPERDKACGRGRQGHARGEAAARALAAAMLAGREVRRTALGQDRHRNLIVVCRPGGADVRGDGARRPDDGVPALLARRRGG